MPRIVEIERVCDKCKHWRLESGGAHVRPRDHEWPHQWWCAVCLRKHGLGPVRAPYRPASEKEKP